MLAPMSDDVDEKARVLAALRRVTDQTGRVPGRRAFQEATGLDRRLWQGGIWTTWSQAVAEAGLPPNSFSQALSEEQFLRPLAELTREKNGFPTQAELTYAHRHNENFPSVAGFTKRFGLKEALMAALREWVNRHEEFLDILQLLDEPAPTAPLPKLSGPVASWTTSKAGAAPEVLPVSLVPPVVACLADLATNSAFVATVRVRGVNADLEFERRTGIAFRLLGLEVQQLGQGAGREPDGLATCQEHGWAIVYDAKLRQGDYRIGTEDRKFKEYLEKHQAPLARRGLRRIYFAVVSGTFIASDVRKAQEIARLTDAKSCVLLSVQALLRMVEIRLLQAPSFDHHWLERQFQTTRIFRECDIEAAPGNTAG